VLGGKQLKMLQGLRDAGQGLMQVGTDRPQNDPDGCVQARQRAAQSATFACDRRR